MSLVKPLFGFLLMVAFSVAVVGCKPPEPITPTTPTDDAATEETPAGADNLTNDIVEPSSNLTTEPMDDEIEPAPAEEPVDADELPELEDAEDVVDLDDTESDDEEADSEDE